uniref:Ovule protein n=1 Tax=Strongyloides venezuelensis TaxID=75913 RepID=A0A0K0FFE9_STRVS
MTVLCGIDVDWSGCLDYPIPFSFITSHALCTKLTSDPPCPVKRLGLDVWMVPEECYQFFSCFCSSLLILRLSFIFLARSFSRFLSHPSSFLG